MDRNNDGKVHRYLQEYQDLFRLAAVSVRLLFRENSVHRPHLTLYEECCYAESEGRGGDRRPFTCRMPALAAEGDVRERAAQYFFHRAAILRAAGVAGRASRGHRSCRAAGAPRAAVSVSK